MRRLYFSFLLCCIECFCIPISIFAQNLELVGKEKPVSISGGLSLSQIFYTSQGINSRRDPYSYFASGSINFSLYGWSVPVSFSLSNQNTSFQQPFNQYSIHPTYKSVTGHVGYVNMSYSPYTVNGHIFSGVAVDVAPEGKWKFSGLYGRFLKAVEPDTSYNAQNPAFKRVGYGFKASYGQEGDVIDVILFHAKDDRYSIRYVPDSLNMLPQENLVVSIGGSKTIFDRFIVKTEFATSALTRDIRADEVDKNHILAKAKLLYTSRLSSSYYNAFKTSLNYQQDGYTIGVAYEHVDPQYKTLGAYYFNNDLENITVNGAASILQGKMNVAVSAGTQRDNLDKNKVSTMRRMVSSINMTYAASQQLNFSSSYSNFQTYTNIRSQFLDINQLTPYDNLDTLNYTQISQNATLTAMYMFGKNKNRKQSLNANLSFQDAADKQGDVSQNSSIQFYNANAAYGLNLVPPNMMVSIAFNGTVNSGAGINTKTLGPTASVTKSFFDKKLRTTLSSSYNTTFSNRQRISTVMNGRLSANYAVRKKHNLNLSMVVLKRQNQAETASRSFTEFTGTLGYSYSFGVK
ncbi:hypothetical protein [Chryseosolibacter indicus]|uniref:DUF5723 domain-containing protein n=1 Tax=Chryseosolibacter indicus TaxID=2782351 RepID=A0ABS5VVF7_9BACT|nr:hypothetical protein [Chryseosolibacter indicus]MBT1705422.1 hypothetical protein [Chryseosolibacter indicus]